MPKTLERRVAKKVQQRLEAADERIGGRTALP